MSNINLINHLSAHIIQGRHDVIVLHLPLQKPALAWGKNARLQMIDEAGHSTFERGIAHALLAALDTICIFIIWTQLKRFTLLTPVGAASLLQITLYYCILVSGTVSLGISTDGSI